MSVTLSPSEPTDAIRLKNFNFTINVSAPGSITDISVALTGAPEPITIIIGESSFTVSGVYQTGFTDLLTYVNEGSSNLAETPTSVIGIQNMPDGKALFDLDQDQKQSLVRTYTVTVKYDDVGTVTENLSLNHTVQNDLESIRSFMANYFN